MKQSNKDRFEKIRELARVVSTLADSATPETRRTLLRCSEGIVSRAHELEHLCQHVDGEIRIAHDELSMGRTTDTLDVLQALKATF